MSTTLLKRPEFWIALSAVAFVAIARMTGLGDLLSIDALRMHRHALVAWVNANQLLAAATYILVYAAGVAASLPGAVILTLTGGLLFGAAVGTILTTIGATFGATIIFLSAKRLFGDRAGNRLFARYPKLVEGIRRDAWSYLLTLRFVPLFPFFLVNLAPAFVGVRLSTFILTTFFGILPGTTVYSLSGAGLGSILDQTGNVSIASIMTPTVVLAFIGLAALSLLAIPIRRRLLRRIS